MGKLLDQRRQQTQERFQQLRDELKDAETRCDRKACVYATGSFARGEANPHSDLDLFIVGRVARSKRALPGLDEILLKADLIKATRKLGIPDFSGEGEYLTHYTVKELVDTLGKPEDDVNNTFTARLLLLLESSPLVGKSVYDEIIPKVVAAYWRDYDDHKTEFMPAFLANDILRMWRTFCVNYEARTQSAPPKKKAKRRLKNYKLKHSRLLTCYSALLYLLTTYKSKGTVSPEDARRMIALAPTERLEWLLRQKMASSAHRQVRALIRQYEEFLGRTGAPERELVKVFMRKKESKEYLESAYQFGNAVQTVLHTIGKGNLFYRLLVV